MRLLHGPRNRSNNEVPFLSKIADLIESKLDILAVAESMDNGKPITLKTVDIPRAALNFRFFSQAITQFYSESHEKISQKSSILPYVNPLALWVVFRHGIYPLLIYLENSTCTGRWKL